MPHHFPFANFLELIARPKMAHLVVGCGYLGRRVARLWRNAGDRVTVMTRNEDRAARLSEESLDPIVADVTQAGSLTPLGDMTDVREASKRAALMLVSTLERPK